MIGLPHVHHRTTDSTNARARELAAGGAPHGTLVTADEQTAGRGRQGRTWLAAPGEALLVSVVVRDIAPVLPLATAVAVAETCEAAGAAEARIKWPNDVWIDEAKVAGVLIEARPPAWAVIGIGVNVAIEPGEFPDDLRWPAASIGRGATVQAVRGAVSAALGRWVEAPEERVLAEFRRRDALAGREIGWEGAGVEAGSGTAAGIDDRGNLVVETTGGDTLALGSGEVTLRLDS